MFKLQRPINNRASKSRERVDFKFSNFQALQVPKGWDRLFLYIISVETGKTIAKLGKALVKNGGCQWTEAISESIYITRDDSSKVYEDCFVKLIVSTGSTRSTTLGEATINMGGYASSKVSTFSQPLKKCSYGTVLQVKIQCLAPRSKSGDEESKHSNSQENDRIVDDHETDRKSYRSDNSSDSIVEHPREYMVTTSSPLKLDSKEASQSSSATAQSFDSLERSTGKENVSKKNAFKSEEYNSFENQVGSIYNTSPLPNYHSFDDISPSNHSSSNTGRHVREDLQNEETVNRRSSSSMTNNVGSSKHLLEAAEDTIDELRAEAKMWERNARKLMIDLDLSRNELSDLSRKQSELVIELSAANAENDSLMKEVEKLTTNQFTQDPIIHSENTAQIQKELENEVKYQQDLIDNLHHQLKQSQESNIELVSVLQELEETIEQQRIEIENLSSLKIDSEKKLQCDIQLLEKDLRDKTEELENERISNRGRLLQHEKDYEYKISVKEEEIASLEATLSGYVKGEHFEALDDNKENHEDLITEIESLREKVQELEKDCSELTDENLELIFKLKDSNKVMDIKKCSSFESMSSGEHPIVCPSVKSDVTDPKFQISANGDLERDFEMLESKKNELENALFVLQEENIHLQERVSGLETQVRRLKDENEFCLQETNTFKSVALSLEDEIEKLKIEMDIQTFVLIQKSDDMMKHLLGAQDENITLTASVESSSQENLELRNSNSVLKIVNQELRDQLNESKKSLSDCTEKLELLEDHLTLLQEVQSTAETTENKLNAALQESESKTQHLTAQLAASKQSHEKLMADHERTLKLLANYKRSEEKLKTELNDLELKHTISDYEHRQLTKEMGILKVQLQNMSVLEDENANLKGELKLSKADKGKLELALQTVSSDYEELKSENVSFSEKISILHDAMSELEECKKNKIVLEEKLLQMEKELNAKEIIRIQNSDLKNELGEIKRENAHFQKKMNRLEEEKIECLRKAQALEEEVKILMERNNSHKEDAYVRDSNDQSPVVGASNKNRVLHESRNPAGQKNHAVSSKKSSEVVARERYERTKSSLETELRDLRERYLEMSLKYAEVETEREDLVMRLKATRGPKRWFS